MLLSNSTVNAHGGSWGRTPSRFPRILFWPGPWFSCPSYSARCPLLQLPSQYYKFWQRRGSESEVVGCWSLPTLMVPMVAIETTGWAPTTHSLSSWYLGMWPMYLYRESFPCSTTWWGKRGQFPWPGGLQPPAHSRSADHGGSLLRWRRHTRLGFLSNTNVGRKSCWFNTAWRENCSPEIISLLCKTSPNFH